MKIKVMIEIPKGLDRRIHMADDKSGFKDYGPIKEKIPINNGVMPVNYGYVENAINKTEGDNVDVILLSNNKYVTGDEAEAEVIGLFNRDDGDHKIVAVDSSVIYKSFSKVPAQERELILDYFGYGHKIIIKDEAEALEYLADCRV